MPVTFNPQIMHSQKTYQNMPFKGDNFASPEQIQAAVNEDSLQVNDQLNNEPTGIIGKVAYAWINFSEGTNGIFKGLVYGALTGGVIAGCDKIVAKIKGRPMGKVGKIVAPIVGVIVLGYHMIMARLTANQRTANVDHMLYDGHRSEVEEPQNDKELKSGSNV